MRVLLAAKHPPGGRLPIGGVQSWIETVAAELSMMGHDVVVWGPEWTMPRGRFDAGIVAHVRHTSRAFELCRRVVVVSHGVIPDEDPGAVLRVVCTSEGVARHWQRDAAIVRQPIDLRFWSPGSEPRRPLLVRASYRGGLEHLPQIAASLGVEFVHARDLDPVALRDLHRQAACVVATGRAALEAMACGAPVVIADDRDYQGPLLDPDTLGAMSRNYSGRGGVEPSASALKAAIESAMQAGSLRAHVEAHHNARTIAQELLCSIC